MRIVACLAWYREPLLFLDRLVRSLGGHVDALVALDGPWKGFDGDVTSPREERDTIRAAAAAVDLPTRVVVPPKRWESQTAKRGELARLAIEEHSADWLLVVDGDVELVQCDDVALRRSLELTDRDVATVLVKQLNRSWPYSELPVNDMPQRHIYRGIPGLEYRYAHNGIVTPDGSWLCGDLAYVSPQPALDLTRVVTYAHDNANRGNERNDAARAYRKRRDRENLEVWSR